MITDVHPESHCHRCDGPNIAWTVSSPLWNAVMRGGSINGAEIHDGIVCPICFVELAEKAQIADLWRLTAHRVHVELETVTPSGRVWDEVAQRWRDPGSPLAQAQQDTHRVQAILDQRDEQIRDLVNQLKLARACLLEHAGCEEPECRAEIAKALGESG